MIQIGDRQRIRLARAERHTRGEHTVSFIEKDEGTSPLVDRHEIDASVPIQVRRRRHSEGGVWRAEGNAALKTGAAVVEVNEALSALAVWHGEIDESVAVEIRWSNGGRRLMGEGDAVRIELAVPPVQADIVRALAVVGSVGDD